MSYEEGTLWNFITEENATKVCKNMYIGDKCVESDLVNSYAWDTAIVYIQAMGNENYANVTCKVNNNENTLKNTGNTGDEKCHIYDMAGNLREWTTEYSTRGDDENKYPCVIRGGSYKYGDEYTAYRNGTPNTYSGITAGFRPLLYLK